MADKWELTAQAAAYIEKESPKYDRVDIQNSAMEEARAALTAALNAAVAAGDLPAADTMPAWVMEVPADTKNGDFAANVALVSAKIFGMAPRKIAEAIVAHFTAPALIEKVEIAGPGFINLFLSNEYYAGVVAAAACTGQNYGRTNTCKGENVNVEFVSANPTGPMHLGNARGGALGDSLAALFDLAGADIGREFYVNDAGNQIAKFGRSLGARYLQIIKGEEAVPFPEDGYQGDDIRQRAKEFYDMHGDAFAAKPEAELDAALVEYALPHNLSDMRATLAKYRIDYDLWFSEQSLYDSGDVQKTVNILLEKGAAYEKDGTVWFKATDYGCDKDDVLVRGNGIPTYFAADIAYHVNKFKRGYTQLIDVWGADHHGHVARVRGGLNAMGYDGSKFDVVLMQLVRLIQGGQQVRMSKRTGKAITLIDLLDEVPIDSARFFFNMREPGSAMEFDLDLAVAEDSNNPVYYVQYAHARICSILRTLEEEEISFDPQKAFAALHLLQMPEERALIRKIGAFPGEIARAATSMDPARITHFVIDVANLFHKFYASCHIKGEEENLLQARLALAVAAKNLLQNGLSIFKIKAPERM